MVKFGNVRRDSEGFLVDRSTGLRLTLEETLDIRAQGRAFNARRAVAQEVFQRAADTIAARYFTDRDKAESRIADWLQQRELSRARGDDEPAFPSP